MTQTPRFEDAPAFRFAGLQGRFTAATRGTIPALWARFAPYLDAIGDRADFATYGICAATADGALEYTAAVAVRGFDATPAELARLELPARRYAVFLHAGHVAQIHETFAAIWGTGLRELALEAASAPEFERYDERFDPQTGLGGVEIWVPLKP